MHACMQAGVLVCVCLCDWVCVMNELVAKEDVISSAVWAGI